MRSLVFTKTNQLVLYLINNEANLAKEAYRDAGTLFLSPIGLKFFHKGIVIRCLTIRKRG